MIALAAAAMLAAGPNERAYRLTVHAPPNARIVLRVRTAPGWIGALCTPRICSLSMVTIIVPPSGNAVSELHLYRMGAHSAKNPHASVTAGAHSALVITP